VSAQANFVEGSIGRPIVVKGRRPFRQIKGTREWKVGKKALDLGEREILGEE